MQIKSKVSTSFELLRVLVKEFDLPFNVEICFLAGFYYVLIYVPNNESLLDVLKSFNGIFQRLPVFAWMRVQADLRAKYLSSDNSVGETFSRR